MTKENAPVEPSHPVIDLAVPPSPATTDRSRHRFSSVLATAAFAVMIAGGATYALLRPAAAPPVPAPAARPPAPPQTDFVLHPRPVADPRRPAPRTSTGS